MSLQPTEAKPFEGGKPKTPVEIRLSNRCSPRRNTISPSQTECPRGTCPPLAQTWNGQGVFGVTAAARIYRHCACPPIGGMVQTNAEYHEQSQAPVAICLSNRCSPAKHAIPITNGNAEGERVPRWRRRGTVEGEAAASYLSPAFLL